MGLSAVRGQGQAVGILKRCVAEGRIAHAYLFHGPDGVGKELAAANFAKLLACRSPKGGDACDFCSECLAVERKIHPDILWLRPSGKRRIIPIGDVDNPEEGSVRYFQRRVALKPFQARWKIGIFVDADSMEGPAENALLKTLEEPPARTVIVLLSSRPESLLPTTLSRCQAVRFGPMREAELEKLLREEHRMPAADAKALSRMTEGRYGEAVAALREDRLAEARLLSRRLSAGETGYWRAVAGPLDIFDQSLARACKALEIELARRGLADPAGAGRGATPAGAAGGQGREREASAFVEGERRRRQMEMLRQVLAWHRDLLVWKLTREERLLMGAGTAAEIERAARGMSGARMEKCVRHVEDALKALSMNADFHLVMENLLVQLTAPEG